MIVHAKSLGCHPPELIRAPSAALDILGIIQFSWKTTWKLSGIWTPTSNYLASSFTSPRFPSCSKPVALRLPNHRNLFPASRAKSTSSSTFGSRHLYRQPLRAAPSLVCPSSSCVDGSMDRGATTDRLRQSVSDIGILSRQCPKQTHTHHSWGD